MTTVAETIVRAKACHGAGQLRDAEQLYRRALEADPDNLEARYLLGAACHALGNPSEAISHLQQLLRFAPRHAEAHNLLGAFLEQQCRVDEAMACFQRAVDLQPENAEAHFNLGTLLVRCGNLEPSVASFRRALELKPDNVAVYNGLGVALGRLGRLDDAIVNFQHACRLDPRSAEASNNLRRALATRDNRSGNALAAEGKPTEAIRCYQRALTLEREYADVHRNLGDLLQAQGSLDEAEVHLRRAVALKPDDADAHNGLGAVFQRQGSLDEAALCYRRALQLAPDHANAHNNLGSILHRQGRIDEAVSHYRRALELQPDDAEAHHNLGHALLLLGNLAEGWSEYEWNWKRKGKAEEVLDRPRWTGEPLAGRTILLRSDQGSGDALQFIRYAEILKQQGASVVVECQPQLVRLLASCPGVDRVIAAGMPRPAFDFHLPLLSLFGVCCTSRQAIPAKVPYLRPDQESIDQWKSELCQEPAFKIGIAWQGSPTNKADRYRSIPLAQFAALARLPGVRVYSLQMGPGREQLSEPGIPPSIVDLGDHLGDFHHTAAMLCNLDLVITCDSAPAHLAGAQGVPVWVALSTAPDWRWLLDRTDTPWYPTMRLYRQASPGDWSSVFQRIEKDLADLTRLSPPGVTR